jgi:hypothetical protein
VRWRPRLEEGWLFEAQALREAGEVAEAMAVCRRGMVVAERSERLRSLLEELGRPR